MPRSSRHKSSKHSSRDLRNYSDSEDDSGSTRERKGGGEEGKRRVDSKDSKDMLGSGNGEYVEDRGSSKRRKDKFSVGVSDRWNGCDVEVSIRTKSSSESKSRRREDENENVRRSGKSERHRESSRREGRESGRNEREGKAEKMDEQQEIDTDSRSAAASESENFSERRTRKRIESFDEGGKYQYDVEDTKDRRALSGDDTGRGGRQKDEKIKDGLHRDKYRELVGKDSKNKYDKQKDGYPVKDRNGSKSNEKYVRGEKDILETRPKRSKSHDSDRDINPSREHDRHRDQRNDRERDSDQDRDRDHEHDPGWDHSHDGDRNRERTKEWIKDHEKVHSSSREKERGHDLERGKDKDRNQEREHDHDHDRDYGDSAIRHKDNRGKKRSSEDCDDYYGSKLRDSKSRSSNMETKSLSGSRVEIDDKDGSHQREGHIDNVMGSGRSRSRASPTSWSHGGILEDRHENDDDPKYRDSSKERRLRALSPKESTGFSGPADISSKYIPYDKYNKAEDGHLGLSAERPSGSKASPRGLTERSPSSSSFERNRSNSRPSIRWNPDSDETRRRMVGSADGRDLPVAEGRPSRELSMGRHSVDESSQVDSSFNGKSGPSNTSSLIPPQHPRRNSDSNLARGHGNNWRGYPNWPSPVPSGFVPFPHGPPHGNFPAMMPHFAAPSLFSVRPPMDINPSALPYHMADDRFPGPLRPIGWQSMIDASGIPPFHGWERSSGILREESHLYQGPDWDQNRHLMNIRGWESNSDHLKGQNGDLSADAHSAHKKEDWVDVPGDDIDSKEHGSTSDSLLPKDQAKHPGSREVPPSEREVTKSFQREDDVLGPASESRGVDTLAQLSRAYLSKLDISSELADPELYDQCLTLVGGGDRAPILDGNSTLNMVEEGHGKGAQDVPWSGLPFLPVDDSVFQKAMDCYKKQRLEPWSSLPLSNLGPLGMQSFADEDKVDQHDHILNEDKNIDEEIPHLSLPTNDEMNLETQVAGAGQKSDCILSDEAPNSAGEPCRSVVEGSVDSTIQLSSDDHEDPSGAQASCDSTRIMFPRLGAQVQAHTSETRPDKSPKGASASDLTASSPD
ncbi:hypothetical protein SAY86_011499 [Trapa natans]|uniref:Uncharacterized protein n=1 Tax=Trapa natans TaxID=22666 RepID=A0AAN7R567_TRANT|nr:hypothetical protein SAY86_011499 [Trapa natans]